MILKNQITMIEGLERSIVPIAGNKLVERFEDFGLFYLNDLQKILWQNKLEFSFLVLENMTKLNNPRIFLYKNLKNITTGNHS